MEVYVSISSCHGGRTGLFPFWLNVRCTMLRSVTLSCASEDGRGLSDYKFRDYEIKFKKSKINILSKFPLLHPTQGKVLESVKPNNKTRNYFTVSRASDEKLNLFVTHPPIPSTLTILFDTSRFAFVRFF
jgi:hypothetical protein